MLNQFSDNSRFPMQHATANVCFAPARKCRRGKLCGCSRGNSRPTQGYSRGNRRGCSRPTQEPRGSIFFDLAGIRIEFATLSHNSQQYTYLIDLRSEPELSCTGNNPFTQDTCKGDPTLGRTIILMHVKLNPCRTVQGLLQSLLQTCVRIFSIRFAL